MRVFIDEVVRERDDWVESPFFFQGTLSICCFGAILPGRPARTAVGFSSHTTETEKRSFTHAIALNRIIDVVDISQQPLVVFQAIAAHHTVAPWLLGPQPHWLRVAACWVQPSRYTTVIHVEEWMLNNIVGFRPLVLLQVETRVDHLLRLLRDIVAALRGLWPNIDEIPDFLVYLFLSFRLEGRVSGKHCKPGRQDLVNIIIVEVSTIRNLTL